MPGNYIENYRLIAQRQCWDKRAGPDRPAPMEAKMRWEDFRRSDNVEDDRDSGGGGFGGGGGGFGLPVGRGGGRVGTPPGLGLIRCGARLLTKPVVRGAPMLIRRRASPYAQAPPAAPTATGEPDQ